MDLQGIKQDELAMKSGVSQATIHKLTSGKARESRKISKIADALGVNTDWLALGKGAKHPNKINESNAEYGPTLAPSRLVPIVGNAQLGDNGHWTEIDYPTGHGDGYINYPTKDNNAYAIRCVGDSMKPRIKNGEFVIVEPNTSPIPGDEVLVKSTDGRVMVKTLLYIRDDRVQLQSVNEAHPSIAVEKKDIIILHTVAAIVKSPHWIK